jgi:hypothetical protein
LRLRICCLASGSCSIGPRRPGARVSRSAPKTTAGSLGGRVAIQVAPTIDPNSNARHTIASPPSNRFARIATAQDAAAIHNATTRDVGTVRMSYRLNTGGRRRPQPARTGLFVAAGHGLQRCGLQTGIFDRQQWHNADAPGELQGISIQFAISPDDDGHNQHHHADRGGRHGEEPLQKFQHWPSPRR